VDEGKKKKKKPKQKKKEAAEEKTNCKGLIHFTSSREKK